MPSEIVRAVPGREKKIRREQKETLISFIIVM